MLNSLVREHCSEGRPAGIQNGFSHAGFGKLCSINVAYCDVTELPHNAGGKLVMEISTAVAYLRFDGAYPALFAGALGGSKFNLGISKDALSANGFAIRECGEFFQPQVDADAGRVLARLRGFALNVDNDIQEPVSPAIAREIRAVFNLPIGEWPAIEDSVRFPGKSKGITMPFQIGAFNRNPAERPLEATITQARLIPLRPGLCVLLANGIDGRAMQSEFFTATGREVAKIESGQPPTTKPESVFLSVVAVIEDEINRPGLLV
jgi:hypothetical protein